MQQETRRSNKPDRFDDVAVIIAGVRPFGFTMPTGRDWEAIITKILRSEFRDDELFGTVAACAENIATQNEKLRAEVARLEDVIRENTCYACDRYVNGGHDNHCRKCAALAALKPGTGG